ncbi:MAG: RagB/SusD family nutrient uptake outer membrane protein [Flavobacteriaceae bacterium]|nr:RagB/SusD family nutrient uptake outer membrane protein [Flavobacteriaceae bacterium]
MKINWKNIFFIGTLVSMFMLTSCTDDLKITPEDDDNIASDEFYNNPASYKQVLAKLYAGLAISGQEGPAGRPDITGIDEGFSQYLRQYWLAQEVTTDEAVIGWADGSLPDYHEHDWNENNEFVRALYNRILYQITVANEFLRQTSDAKLDARGVTGTLRSDIAVYRAEARFLRALSYWHALDLYGNFPFVTEKDAPGYFFPEQKDRTFLFNFIETELKDVEATLLAPKSNEYARADKAAAWMLLAKLYLNAAVYTGTAKYGDCVIYSKKVIDAGYVIEPAYKNLFLADNHTANGVIFPIAFDGLRTQSWGGTTFIIHAAIGGNMNPADFGVNGGWGGTRTTSALVNKFDLNLDLVAANNAIGTASLWGLVGNLNDWGGAGPDIALRQTGTTNIFAGFVKINNDGELKFRYNHDWGNNYGDNGANGTIDAGGDNIKVKKGTYRISLNLANNTYTIVEVKDARADFHRDGQKLEIESIGTFTDGYAIRKFKNVTRTGVSGSDKSGNHTDTDFPMFRIEDAYLMYAEATVRGGAGGNVGLAVGYVNQLKQRALGSTAANISSTDLTLNFILDERARELYWECHRRTDLIRFGRFTTGTYQWPWKGGVANGTATQVFRNIFPIPSSDLNANPNLKQNPGY